MSSKITNEIIDFELVSFNSIWIRIDSYINHNKSIKFKCKKCNCYRICRYSQLKYDIFNCKNCNKAKYITKSINNKICRNCEVEKDRIEFSKSKSNNDGLKIWCKDCCKDYKKKYALENADKISKKIKINYQANKKALISKVQIYEKKNPGRKKKYDENRRILHKEKIKEASKLKYINNKEAIIKSNAKYTSKRYKEDGKFRVRSQISSSVNKYLKNKGFTKGGSIFNYLPYSKIDLYKHLEDLFEGWMTWRNYGPYKINEWVDNDVNTWKWSLDHIIPQSKFEFMSMNDEGFIKCWALENLRPLSAKENVVKGNR